MRIAVLFIFMVMLLVSTASAQNTGALMPAIFPTFLSMATGGGFGGGGGGGGGGGAVSSVTGTTNQIICAPATGDVICGTPQNIATVSSPTFSGLTLNGKLAKYNGSVATNGQLLIGNTSTGNFDTATLTGTANQISITNGNGSITLALPSTITTPGNLSIKGTDPFIDITAYGAVCDNSTDDTTAIQNALNAASFGGWALYIPPSTHGCKVTSAITNTSAVQVNIFGAGRASVLRTPNAISILNLAMNPGGNNNIHDLEFMGDVANVVGLELSGSTSGTNSHNSFKNLSFEGVNTAIKVSKVSAGTAPELGFNWNIFDGLDIANNPNGTSGNVDSINGVVFVNGSGTGNILTNVTCVITTGVCLDYQGNASYNVGDILINSWHIAVDGGIGMRFSDTSLYKFNVSITGSQFEGTGTSVIIPPGFATIQLIGNSWGGGVTSTITPGTGVRAFLMTNTSPLIYGDDSKFVISKNTATAPTSAFTGINFHVVGADAANTNLLIDNFGTGNNPILSGRKARGTAASASQTAVQTNDPLLVIGGSGYGATGYSATRGSVTIAAAENWTDSAQGTNIFFATTATGTTTTANVVSIDGAGDITANGILRANTGFSANGTAGISDTIVASVTCTFTVAFGLVTSKTGC